MADQSDMDDAAAESNLDASNQIIANLNQSISNPTTSNPLLVHDQSTNLPSKFPDTLPAVNKKLSTKADYVGWAYSIKEALETYDIEDLIDLSLPRPKLGSSKYDRWREYSKRVKTWLSGQIASNVTDQVIQLPDASRYADDHYSKIISVINGEGTMSYAMFGVTQSI